jgi:hypothetical protein
VRGIEQVSGKGNNSIIMTTYVNIGGVVNTRIDTTFEDILERPAGMKRYSSYVT